MILTTKSFICYFSLFLFPAENHRQNCNMLGIAKCSFTGKWVFSPLIDRRTPPTVRSAKLRKRNYYELFWQNVRCGY